MDDYFALRYPGSPQVSPDGRWVAYTVSGQDLANDRRFTRIWMVPLAGGEPMFMTARDSSAWSPRWAPDGEHLSFIATSGEGSSQVYTLDIRGGERVQLTDIAGGVESYEWSPDGKRLVLVLRDPEKDKGPGPWVIDRLTFKQDYVGYLDRRRVHLYMYDLDSQSVTQITAGDYEDYSPKWSPDGSRIAFVSNRTEEPDSNWNTDIWLVDPDTPHDEQEPVRVTTNPWSDDSPIWHPDGERIGYITSYTNRTDVPGPYLRTKVAIIRIGEDEPRLLTTEELDRKAYGPAFSPDGGRIYVMLEDDGQVQLASVSGADGELERLVKGQVRAEEIAVAPDGSVVAAISGPILPSDLFVLEAGASERRRLTHVNDELLRSVFLSDVEELRFPTLDGTEIQTFVYKPQNFVSEHRYPTILWLHGGQESQYDYGFNFRVQLFAAEVSVVVMPNVRGSGGRGQEFALALNKAYGTADVEDVIVATDYVIEQGYVDPDRLGIGGWSSGGTLTNFVIAKTDRFAGAISGAMMVENITTPTLFIHGEKDWNQPVIHSEQMYQAMRYLGREALLVVYPGAYHGIRRPVYHKDLLTRFVDWFDKYVKDPDARD